jgi:hypothetical protein
VTTQTLIQLKYSSANSSPTTLDIAEPAYSFVSNKLFVGDLANNPIAIGGKYYTDLLDANTSYAIDGTLVVRGTDGNTNFDELHANTINSNTTIFAGHAYGGPLPGATNPLIGATGNANSYVQSYVRNINSGTEASADYVAYSDIGSDVSGWIDMGITSSTYNDESYSLTGPEEGYIFMSATNGSETSGNLVIATDSTGTYNDIVFQTGGFTGAPRPIAYFRNNQGLIIKADSEASSNITGSLVSTGGAGFQGNVYADALYDFNSRVLSTIVTAAGGGATLSQSKSGNTVTLTVNNTGVHSLTANTGDLSANGTTGNLVIGLTDTTVTPGIYGGTTQVPTFTVDAKGRLTQAGNVAISTSFTLAGNTGTDTFNTGDTLFFKGDGTGIVTTVSDNTVSIATDTTVLRSNTTSVGPQTIQTDLTVTGNLIVRGDQVVANTVIVKTDDSLIHLAANNTTDAIDIGFYGQYDDSGIKYAGLIRKAGGQFYLFADITDDPSSNVVVFDSSTDRGSLDANLTGGTVSGLNQAIAIVDGGTNSNTFTTGQILHYNGTSIVSLANTGTAGTYGNTSHVAVVTTDDLGRVSSVTNTAIAIDASAVTSGLLAIARGGSNNDTFTDGAFLRYDGSKFSSVANTGTAGTYGNTTHIPVITTDDYGRVSGVANTALVVDLSTAITGTLGVVNGGTGSSSFTVKGVVVSDSASSTGALTALTGSAYQVLQLNSSGVPVFGGINGGTF